ncbi:uncharacterized protein VTP21DRAFT_8777 [Calcarisporiella thermophila]|uniref:uncharacterized protein n=1 Tax=Calcarisporiella thermophila TaxID=911321 RepID=UPI0037447D31
MATSYKQTPHRRVPFSTSDEDDSLSDGWVRTSPSANLVHAGGQWASLSEEDWNLLSPDALSSPSILSPSTSEADHPNDLVTEENYHELNGVESVGATEREMDELSLDALNRNNGPGVDHLSLTLSAFWQDLCKEILEMRNFGSKHPVDGPSLASVEQALSHQISRSASSSNLSPRVEEAIRISLLQELEHHREQQLQQHKMNKWSSLWASGRLRMLLKDPRNFPILLLQTVCETIASVGEFLIKQDMLVADILASVAAPQSGTSGRPHSDRVDALLNARRRKIRRALSECGLDAGERRHVLWRVRSEEIIA